MTKLLIVILSSFVLISCAGSSEQLSKEKRCEQGGGCVTLTKHSLRNVLQETYEEGIKAGVKTKEDVQNVSCMRAS